MRATSASSASAATGPAERNSSNCFITSAAAWRIFRTRSSYFASNSLRTSEVIRFPRYLFQDRKRRRRSRSGCAALNAANDPAQMPGDRDQEYCEKCKKDVDDPWRLLRVFRLAKTPSAKKPNHSA